MHSQTLLIALTLAVGSFAAPLKVAEANAVASSSSGVTTTGYGQVRRGEKASSGEFHTDGYGQVRRENSEEEAATLSKRTGYGIISGGTDEA